jgi:feruloyl esterase
VLAHDPNARSYFRTFLLPGVLHCGGGAGPDAADWTAALVDWAENGKAPDRVIASKIVNGTVARSRPLLRAVRRAAARP